MFRRWTAAALSAAVSVLLSGSQVSAAPNLAPASSAPAANPARVQMLNESGGAYQAQVVSYKDLPFRSVVRQQYDFSCGSAALATLLRYHYGVAVGETDVFKAMYAVGDQAKIRKVGFSLLDMKRYLQTEGMISDGYKAPLDVLAKTGTPAVAVISVGKYKHFVVIKGMRGGLVLVGDPAIGIKAYSASKFSQMWDGILFVIHDHAPRKPAFDSNVEWGYVPNAPLSFAMNQSQGSISALTRDLPIAFQITPVIRLPIAARSLIEMRRSRVAVALALGFSLARSTWATAAPAKVAEDWSARTPMNAAELQAVTGGFITADGVNFSFGAVVQTFVDGQLALSTTLNVLGPNQVTRTVATAPGLGVATPTNDGTALTFASGGGITTLQQLAGANGIQNITATSGSNQLLQQSTAVTLTLYGFAPTLAAYALQSTFQSITNQMNLAQTTRR